MRAKVSFVLAYLLCISVAAAHGQSDVKRPPIIDVHLHAQDLWARPGAEASETFGPEFTPALTGMCAAESTGDFQRRSLAALERYYIVKAVTSGERADAYRQAAPDKIIASPLLGNAKLPIGELRVAFMAGRYLAFAGFMPQNGGLAPNDPVL